MKKRKCVSCNEVMEGDGNSIRPLRDEEGRCCDECNLKIVIPYRMIMVLSAKRMDSFDSEDSED